MISTRNARRIRYGVKDAMSTIRLIEWNESVEQVEVVLGVNLRARAARTVFRRNRPRLLRLGIGARISDGGVRLARFSHPAIANRHRAGATP